KQYGRILLGLAMILVALTFMSQVSSGLAESELIRIIISSLGGELLMALLLFAILTWVAHSSIAILLFWASLVQAGITDNNTLIVAAILGINFGNSIPPVIMSMNQEAPARRIVAGHAVIKLSGVIACFLFLRLIAPLYELIPGLPGFRVVILHILFNLGLIVVFSPLANQIARFFERFYVNAVKPGEDIGPRYIPQINAEPGTAGMLPVTALCREILRIQGTIQIMLEATLEMLFSDKHEKHEEVLRMEEKVNLLFKAVRSYAVEVIRQGLDEADQKKVSALLRYTASLENSGDIICKTMIGIPESMKKDGKQFSEEGKNELLQLFRYLIGSTELAAELIMSWRPSTARSLIQRKRELKAKCQESSQRHIDRLSLGVADAMQSSSAHLDLTMNIRWVSTQISSLAYDVLPENETPADDGPEN
ncbi:MAG: Na/Pi cotransporter family protein, partial [Propionivibrio sp.]|nr:Na/Pi cotransporter family protein [Propionivibrio sp.]